MTRPSELTPTLLCLLCLAWVQTGVIAAPDVQSQKDAPAESELETILKSRPVNTGPLSLDRAVEIALGESPVVRGAVAEVSAAAARVAAARAERRPWVSANLFGSGGNNTNIVAGPPPTQPQMLMGLPKGGFFDANLMVMFPLFTSGRLEAMVRQASAQRDATQADLEAQRQEVALMVRMAYRESQARRSLVEVWETRLREDEERLRLDRAKATEGRIPDFYVQRDQAEVAASLQELTNARRDVDLSLIQLRTVMGVGPASKVEVSGSLTYQPSADLLKILTASASPATDLPALLRVAERQRPELKAAAHRIRAAGQESAAIRKSYGPQVGLFAMGDALTESPHAGVTAGVVVSVPVFNGGQNRARTEGAAAEKRRQEHEREKIALNVAQEVETALLNLKAAEQNIGTAQAALTSAREEYRVAMVRYDAGRSEVIEALDALTARVRAESNVVQALFQYNVAKDQLTRAVGSPALTGPLQ